jgi:hypothetical protein
VAELQIRLPYTAWGEGEQWLEGFEEVLGDLFERVEDAGLGVVDDPDQLDDVICFYLDGDDVDALRRVAREVLAQRGMLPLASAMVTDPDANDMNVGTPVTL